MPVPQGTETVLLIEDEPLVRELASTILHAQGYTVLVASNGEDALRIIQAAGGETIDLVVTDVVMPQMGGKMLAEQVESVYPLSKRSSSRGIPPMPSSITVGWSPEYTFFPSRLRERPSRGRYGRCWTRDMV
jgi:CheY-like chemotaxis protein